MLPTQRIHGFRMTPTVQHKHTDLVFAALLHFSISIVKPNTCTSFSNLFYFGITLFMFRTVFPSIVRSSRLHIYLLLYVQS